jgi:hypothetical protein
MQLSTEENPLKGPMHNSIRLLTFGGSITLLVITSLINPSSAQAQFSNPVRVLNTPTQPVPNRDVDQPARQAFDAQATVAIPANAFGGSATFNFTIPAGKRAVVEYVSLLGELPTGQQVALFRLQGVLNNQGTEHYVPVIKQVTGASLDRFVAGQPVTIYADPSLISVEVGRSSTSVVSTQFLVRISGHFVTMP